MNLRTALSLPAKDFWENAEIVKAIQSVLVGPVKHNVVSAPYCYTPHCTKCGASWSDYLNVEDVPNEHGDCPVPPPLTDPPEVVVRKLVEKGEKRLSNNDAMKIEQTVCAFSPRPIPYSPMWFGWMANIEEQAICGLLALGKLEEKET